VFRRKVRRMAKRHVSRRSQNSSVNWEAFNRFTDLHPLVAPSRLTDLIALDRELRSTKGK
jgi:RNA-directed DNA polymerase